MNAWCSQLICALHGLAVIDKPPFEVTETGWGEFEVQIKIFFVAEANEKILTVHHLLKLHPWTVKNNLVVPAPEAGPGTDTMNSLPVHSWQYDEIVFNDPTEALYNIMVQNAATPLYVSACVSVLRKS
jgi:YEATS domain-containing protein 4